LVNTVSEVTSVPLCIDSPDPNVIERGVAAANGKTLINSITAEEARYSSIIPIAVKHKCAIIALTMDGTGMPDTADDRARIAEKLYKIMKSKGMSDDDIYFDPLVRPISSEPGQAAELLRSIPLIKALGNIKVVSGVSNISYGLPKRKIINSFFLALALNAGMDGAIIDPLDRMTISAIRSTEALLGKDKYCMNFIKGHRRGEF
ncbi:MAG: dihydropteroate synthase, partial [Candidatus Omnitrophota bacterium]